MEKKSSKSSDTDSKCETGKHHSHRMSSTTYDTDDETIEKPELEVVQLVKKKFKPAIDYYT